VRFLVFEGSDRLAEDVARYGMAGLLHLRQSMMTNASLLLSL
jgi:hypothetical protein